MAVAPTSIKRINTCMLNFISCSMRSCFLKLFASASNRVITIPNASRFNVGLSDDTPFIRSTKKKTNFRLVNAISPMDSAWCTELS